jgi:hypothetical protein
MDPREQLITYMAEMAKRNADIAHNPATAATTRFFLELNYNKLQGPNEKPNNTGWNLVLMGYESSADDNKHGRTIERVPMVFDILKHVSKSMTDAQFTAHFTAARLIGEELIVRIMEQCKNPCAAFDAGHISAASLVPYNILQGSKKTIEVGPRYDEFYGYRFAVDVLQDVGVKQASDPAKWIPLA